MPEVLDHPQTEQTYRFDDPENARAAGLRSAEVTRLKNQELANLRLILSTKPLSPLPIQQPKDALVEQTVRHQLELTAEQIARTRERLNSDDCGDKERAGLLREIRGLMEHECRLRGIGEPGRVRPVQEPARGRRQVEPIAQPIDRPASCVSNTTTGCINEGQPTRSGIQSSQEPNG